jgi:predicted amidohydrolase
VKVRVAALELPARFDRVADNLDLAGSLLARSPCDLALMPEASLTGYVSPERDFDLTRFAEPRDGPTAHALAELAKKHGAHLVGPLIERDGAAVYNAMIGFDREGREFIHYRKRHPWYPETWATPGTAPHPVVIVDGLRVTIAVCFDIQYCVPELPAADLLLFPSAWVEDRTTDSRAEILSKVGVAVINANWGVGEPRVPGQGGSRILDATGRLLAMAASTGRIDADCVVATVA